MMYSRAVKNELRKASSDSTERAPNKGLLFTERVTLACQRTVKIFESVGREGAKWPPTSSRLRMSLGAVPGICATANPSSLLSSR